MNLPKQDKLQAVFSWMQMILFAVLFLGGIVLLFRITERTLWRVLGVIGLYAAVSLLLYCVIRPLCMIAEAKLRVRKRH